MEKVAENFREAVKNYLEVIGKNYRSRMGYESPQEPYKQKIAQLYGKSSIESRDSLLYYILKTMSRPTGDPRLTNYRRDLALELVEELEKI